MKSDITNFFFLTYGIFHLPRNKFSEICPFASSKKTIFLHRNKKCFSFINFQEKYCFNSSFYFLSKKCIWTKKICFYSLILKNIFISFNFHLKKFNNKKSVSWIFYQHWERNKEKKIQKQDKFHKLMILSCDRLTEN